MIHFKLHLKNVQVQGAEMRKLEAYRAYDECLSIESNAVIGHFRM